MKGLSPQRWLPWLAGLIWVDLAMSQSPPPATIDPALPPLERARSLVAFAGQMVDAAYSGKAHAHAYRIDVAHYREALRDLVKENDARLPRPLLLDMVRMAALLQSAAQCQTGHYIVCPPDLMSQLQRQQALLEQGIAALMGKP